MKHSSKIIYFFLFFLSINISIPQAKEYEKAAQTLISHFNYDDKINNYLSNFFSFSNSKNKNNKHNHFNCNHLKSNCYKKEKSGYSIKIKSKNKLLLNFEDGQSIQINPSNFNNSITYNYSPFSILEIDDDYLFYKFKIDF